MSLHESLTELAEYHAALADRSDAAFLVLSHLVVLLGNRDPKLREELHTSLSALREAAREDKRSGPCGEAIDKMVELLIDGKASAPMRLVWSDGQRVDQA